MGPLLIAQRTQLDCHGTTKRWLRAQHLLARTPLSGCLTALFFFSFLPLSGAFSPAFFGGLFHYEREGNSELAFYSRARGADAGVRSVSVK